MPPIFVVPVSAPAATGDGIEFSRYWQALADKLLTLYDPNLAVLSQAAVEPRRNLIIDRLHDDEGARDAYAGAYVYAQTTEALGSQHKALGQGYHGQYGALALADPPTDAIENGTQLYLTWPLPIRRHNAVKGVADCALEGIRTARIKARIGFTGDGTQEHSLTEYPFIASEDDIIGIWDRRGSSSTDPTAFSPYGFHLQTDGATQVLVTDATYSVSEAFTLEAIVRGDHLVHDGSSWSYPSTPGLVNDTDRAAVPLDWAVAFGMWHGVEQLQKLNALEVHRVSRDQSLSETGRTIILRSLDREAIRLADLASSWGETGKKIVIEDFPRPPAERQRSDLVGSMSARRTSGRWP
jgi:hypothetical protein